MTGKLTWALALASLLAIHTMPASACKVVGHTKSGEKLCMKTSDGKGEVYKKDDRPIFVPDDRPIFVPDDRPVFVPPKHKAQQAMELAKAKARAIEILKQIKWGHN
jgi:hypothetical protein